MATTTDANLQSQSTAVRKPSGLQVFGRVCLLSDDNTILQDWAADRQNTILGSDPSVDFQLDGLQPKQLNFVFGRRNTLIKAVQGSFLVQNRQVREWLIDEPTTIVVNNLKIKIFPTSYARQSQKQSDQANTPTLAAAISQATTETEPLTSGVASLRTESMPLADAPATIDSIGSTDRLTYEAQMESTIEAMQKSLEPTQDDAARWNHDEHSMAHKPVVIVSQDLEQRIEQIERQLPTIIAELESVGIRLEQNLDQTQSTFIDLAGSISNQIESLSNRIQESTTHRTQAVEESLKVLTDRFDELQSKITALPVDVPWNDIVQRDGEIQCNDEKALTNKESVACQLEASHENRALLNFTAEQKQVQPPPAEKQNPWGMDKELASGIRVDDQLDRSQSVHSEFAYEDDSQEESAPNETAYSGNSHNDEAYNRASYRNTAYEDESFCNAAYDNIAYNENASSEVPYSAAQYDESNHRDVEYNRHESDVGFSAQYSDNLESGDSNQVANSSNGSKNVDPYAALDSEVDSQSFKKQPTYESAFRLNQTSLEDQEDETAQSSDLSAESDRYKRRSFSSSYAQTSSKESTLGSTGSLHEDVDTPSVRKTDNDDSSRSMAGGASVETEHHSYDDYEQDELPRSVNKPIELPAWFREDSPSESNIEDEDNSGGEFHSRQDSASAVYSSQFDQSAEESEDEYSGVANVYDEDSKHEEQSLDDYRSSLASFGYQNDRTSLDQFAEDESQVADEYDSEASTQYSSASLEPMRYEEAADEEAELPSDEPSLSKYSNNGSGSASEPAQEAEEEDSVEAYMQKLLARVKGDPEPTFSASQPKSFSAASSSASVSMSASAQREPTRSSSPALQKTAASRGATAPASVDEATRDRSLDNETLTQEAYVPRSAVPEHTFVLNTMRQLANETARTAIADSSSRAPKPTPNVGKKLAISVSGFVLGTMFLLGNGLRFNVGFIGMVCCFLVFLIWGYEATQGAQSTSKQK